MAQELVVERRRVAAARRARRTSRRRGETRRASRRSCCRAGTRSRDTAVTGSPTTCRAPDGSLRIPTASASRAPPHCSNNCFWISLTRARILNAARACRRARARSRRAARGSSASSTARRPDAAREQRGQHGVRVGIVGEHGERRWGACCRAGTLSRGTAPTESRTSLRAPAAEALRTPTASASPAPPTARRACFWISLTRARILKHGLEPIGLAHVPDRRLELVDHQLHPQLRRLVLDDEQHLVVRGPVPPDSGCCAAAAGRGADSRRRSGVAQIGDDARLERSRAWTAMHVGRSFSIDRVHAALVAARRTLSPQSPDRRHAGLCYHPRPSPAPCPVSRSHSPSR